MTDQPIDPADVDADADRDTCDPGRRDLGDLNAGPPGDRPYPGARDGRQDDGRDDLRPDRDRRDWR